MIDTISSKNNSSAKYCDLTEQRNTKFAEAVCANVLRMLFLTAYRDTLHLKSECKKTISVTLLDQSKNR